MTEKRVPASGLRFEAWLVFREGSRGKFPPAEANPRAKEIGLRMLEAAWKVLEEEAPEENPEEEA